MDASGEDLNRSPPVYDECEQCHRMEEDEEDGEFILLRCSTCKNKFYCSVACQNKGWKTHKYDCSLLPIGTLAIKQPLETSAQAQLDAEVQRVSEVLRTWADACDPQTADSEDTAAASSHVVQPEDELIKDLPNTLPVAYSSQTYTRLPAQHASYPFRLPSILIARLFLIHAMTPSPTNTLDEIQRLETIFAGYEGPDPWWPPKYVCRPGDLSPGEYAMLSQVLVVSSMAAIRAGGKEKGDEEVGGEAWKKRAFDMRFVRLMQLMKRRFMTKS
ncbi:hypothetical protein EIP91_011002 [Steccherinum ochraceum]|uniref:MYND-type domain-containing protein n=1 Tax=Steccherinum ochraceum TaxID=92696 RepID=A0A4R0R012_9APHY|nr:hypothetical protein EIP91_011002 [Steccherinum ochraceum]